MAHATLHHHHPIHFGNLDWLYWAVAAVIVVGVVVGLLAGATFSESQTIMTDPNLAP